MTTTSLLLAITLFAPMYGVPTDVAHEVCFLESSYNLDAVGDNGLAVGPYQIHPATWEHLCTEMIEEGELCKIPPLDSRRDPWLSTRVAMYSMGNGYADWWATWDMALANVALDAPSDP